MSDDHGERIATLEAGIKAVRAELRLELRSLTEDHLREIREEVRGIRDSLHGPNGDNGLRSTVKDNDAQRKDDIRWLRWAMRVQWVAIAVLAASLTDVRLPWVIP